MKRLLLAVLTCGCLCTAAAAQTGRAVLVRGPKIGKGIDLFGPNAIPYERGDYEYKGKGVTVYYIRSYLPPLAGWVRSDCGRLPLVSPASESKAFIYEGGSDWSILLVFEANAENTCPFIGAFIERFRYFKRSSGSPFPAAVVIK